jgi:hypothetical protein
MPPISSNNSEIDEALKEFEANSNKEQKIKGIITPQTSAVPAREVEGIKFETDSYKSVEKNNEPEIPKMVTTVMKWSGFKDQKQAEWVLLIFVIVAITISLYLFFGGNVSQQKPNPAAIEQMKQFQQNLINNNNH